MRGGAFVNLIRLALVLTACCLATRSRRTRRLAPPFGRARITPAGANPLGGTTRAGNVPR
ncbi:hypothetical protein SAMN05216241_104102 [Limimonas halophila]|uniref:Uncharacterized protein n=1 Tax=Limimonas halophila TaxID=1082479 RepID=A0A1G7QQ99_9PROT|nr:hypothetical protein SAMN05216241_104102 [Limimonas halophila]